MAKKVTKKANAMTTDAVPAVDPAPATEAKKVSKPRATSVPRATKSVAADVIATTAATSPTLNITDQMIAERAYHLWRNGEPGDHHHHWLTAERELRGQG